MSNALFDLYNIAESHGAPHQAFEKWVNKHYKPLLMIVAAAQTVAYGCDDLKEALEQYDLDE